MTFGQMTSRVRRLWVPTNDHDFATDGGKSHIERRWATTFINVLA